MFIDRMGIVLLIMILETDTDGPALTAALTVIHTIVKEPAYQALAVSQGVVKALLPLTELTLDDGRSAVMALVILRTLCAAETAASGTAALCVLVVSLLIDDCCLRSFD